MMPVEFEEANITFTPPDGMTEDQCQRIRAYRGTVTSPSPVEGMPIVVTAWKPNDEEIKDLLRGKPVYIAMLSSAPCPHMLTTNFAQATQPA